MTRILFRGGIVHAASGESGTTAVAVSDGHVSWLGDEEGAASYADGADRVVELAGRLVTPAFVDAHVHLAQTGLAAAGLELGAAASLHEALDALAGHANNSSAAVLLGFGWDETTWPEGRPFTREELDRATGGRAAYLGRVDEHSAVVSTAFLDACPEVVHAEGYDVSGLITREAHHVGREGLFRLVPGADREAAVLRALDDAARAGIGMVHELGAPHICPPSDFEVIDSLHAAGRRGERAVLPETVGYWGSTRLEDAQRLACAGAAGDLCMDGSIGSRTSALLAPYADDDSCGHLYLEAEQVAEHVVACTRAGLQAGFHVIGDRAVEAVVAGFTRAEQQLGTAALVDSRHRLEHVEMASAADIATLAGLGVVASMQPMFDAYWGGEDSLYAQRLGADRARPMNAFASMRRAGVRLAFGSDSPVTPFDPWAGVLAATEHRTPAESIDLASAFDAHTRGGWYAAKRTGGQLSVGAPASLAVWDAPGGTSSTCPTLPHLAADALPRCAMTLVAGAVAFERTGALE